MTQIQPESHAEARLSGRELARQRRKAMATQGKTVVKPARQTVGRAATSASSPMSRTKPLGTQNVSTVLSASSKTSEASGRAKAQQRREAMGRSGKAELPKTHSGGRSARAAKNNTVRVETRAEGCSCGCKTSNEDADTVTAAVQTESRRAATATAGALTPREISSRLVKNQLQGSGRDVALARRKALSQEGKAGIKRASQATKIAKYLPEKDWRVAIAKGVNGRQLAMQRRKVRSLTGRGEESQQSGGSARKPVSRRAARSLNVPQKVEKGHTLAGSGVTGTMVERTSQVTGNEAGSCRVVTGTEYIGLEQFDAFCKTHPEAGPAKVTLSRTLNGHSVSGTKVASDNTVTGSEYGACHEVTGTQYMSADHFERLCSKRPQAPANKIGVTQTQKGKTLTGTLVTTEGKVTGGEPGTGRDITGTRYARAKGIKPAMEKVSVTHTAGGGQVTGTAVGHSSRMTGDESGACAAVSGTQYLSAEQYTAFCNGAVPRQPRKVSVMSTSKDQEVTGTSVARDLKVTGSEAGSCRSITGTPYFNSQDFGDACAMEGPSKVGMASTRAGTKVSGSGVLSNPKMTGDEEGRCALVTGTDYVGSQDLQAVCAESTPSNPAVAKVAVDKTWQGEVVTGSTIGRSVNITGNEYGACAPVSGTPYVGQNQYGAFCEPPQAEAQRARVPTHGVVSAAEITGDRPGAGGSVMTGDERGACEPVSGTPYLGVDNMSAECGIEGGASSRYVTRRQGVATPDRAPAPSDFSVVSPARQSFEAVSNQAITGAKMNSDRITGSASRAQGLITGTPEFRHRETAVQTVQSDQMNDAVRQRLTGEASPRSATITGDAWSMQQRVTGTEGHFSAARNPTQRGAPRGTGRSAQAYRGIERPEVPESPVTGSAGAAKRGAVVTVSGGARG